MRLYLDDDSASSLLTRLLRQGGHDIRYHPGILVVRKDNNPKRDLNTFGIVRAIGKLLAAAIDLADHFYVLNHWR